MPALFERAIGDDWSALHPRVRERYGLVAADGHLAVGTGEMQALRRSALALPLLALGTVDDFLFPEAGRGVPYTITTRALVDANGYEVLVLRRTFETEPERTFVDTLRWNPHRGCITDLFGRHGLVAADLRLGVEDGDLTFEIGTQWLRVGGRYVRLPAALAVDGSLRDWYDEPTDRFRVTASITNPLLGEVFGYRGHFVSEFRAVASVPADAVPETALDAVSLPGDTS